MARRSVVPAGGLRVPGTQLPKGTLFWLLQSAAWAAFGATMLVWGLQLWPVAAALLNKAALTATGFLLTLGFRLLYRRARARSLPPVAFAAMVAAVSFGGAVVWFEAHWLLLLLSYAALSGTQPALRLGAIPIGTLLYDGFVLLAWSLLYWSINAWMELAEQRERAIRAEAQALDARLRALRSQLEPHFLFNTLNAISTLVVEGKSAAAASMIARLSEFLRMTLEASDAHEIPVAEELEFVRRYLEIEQVRFGARLRVSVEASAEAMGGLVPALVLQPLVENAVKHGVLAREGGGSVEVAVTREDGVLRLSVVDDGPGLPAGGAAGRGLGVANTVARLAGLYGEGSRLALRSSPTGGLAATIEIPFRTAAPAAPTPAAAPAAPAAAARPPGTTAVVGRPR
jgi:two-component system LytT family sensor kinase